MATTSPTYDRIAALQQFDSTKAGVKGLSDSGITKIPSFFHHPPTSPLTTTNKNNYSIPTVDLSLPRSTAVDLIDSASHSTGFFYVTNHNIPPHLLTQSISAVRSFHEQPLEARSSHYSREFVGGVSYASNFDLFRSPAASWRDTIQINMSPTRPDINRIPALCRNELMELDGCVRELGRRLLGMMGEGLGVGSGRLLEEMECDEGRMMVSHYYPWCPQPELTEGLVEHTDPGVLTVLVQDSVGGLQVKGERGWVDVEPVEGAVVINVGDLLQIISNDKYKSVEHRVVANPHKEARVSIAFFLNPKKRGETDLYGPLPELVSTEKPANYRNFTMPEFMGTFFKRGLGSRRLVDHFKL